MSAGLLKIGLVALLCLAPGVAATADGVDETPKNSTPACSVPHAIIPRDLKEWRVDVSGSSGGKGGDTDGPRAYPRPHTKITSDGKLTIQRSVLPDLTVELEKERTEALFAGATDFVNGFYLLDGGVRQNRRDDVKGYEFKMASGGREVRLSFEQADPGRMRLESKAFAVLDTVNRELSLNAGVQNVLSEPLRLAEADRDPRVAGKRMFAPDEFPDGYVSLELSGAEREVSFGVSRNTDPESDSEFYLSVGHGRDHLTVPFRQAPAQQIYEEIRSAFCEFQLPTNRDRPAPVSNERLKIGIGAGGRRIEIQFDHADDVPAEIRAALSRTIDLVNAQIKPGARKISPIWKSE